MAESYSLEAILSARDTNFTSTMDGAQKAMGGLGKSAGGIGASIGKIAAGFGLFKVVSGTISALSSGFSSLASELNESSVAWQVFEGNMSMLGKSSGEIDSTRKSLEKFAQQTIYSASDMAQTYSQMAAIGVEDTETLVKAMGGLAASAENPQQAMKTLSQQMTQAMAKPTLSWADFKLMLEQTPAGMSEVAKEMGYALDDFVVAVQDGEIASKDFAKAVSEVGTNEHFGAMATEFKSVGQAMDGARETIANKLMPAFEMLSAIGIKAISGLTDWIDTLDFSGLLAPIASLASMFGIATDEISAMTDTIKMSSDEIQSVADSWESMTLAEKQATVQTMGQEDLSELLDMLGVDFESIPDEYTKDAFLNTHGKDALEEILWVTGKWHDLTLEEKRAVLEAQIENKPLEEAIENMGLWEDASFVSKFAEINMNDNDSGQQVLDLINYYRELDGQEPIELEVDAKTKPAENAIDKFVGAYKKFGKSIGKVAKGIGKIVEKTGELFEPAFDFLGDASKASLKTLGKYVDATGQLFEGDWSGAWDTFKDATKEGLISVAGSLRTNMPRVWENITGVVDNILEWAGRVDWGAVGTTIMSGIGTAIGMAVNSISDVGTTIFKYITEKVKAVNWSEVGEDIGKWVGDALQKGLNAIKNFDYTKLNEMFVALGETIDALGLALLKLAAGALVGLAKSFGFEKEMKAIQELLDGLGKIDFNGDFEYVAKQIREAFKSAFKGWDLNDWMPKLEWQWDKKNWQFDWATGEVFEVDIETGARVFITEAEIQDMDWSNLLNEADKLGLIEYDADGNVVINADTEFNPDFSHIDQQALVDRIAEHLGIPTVQLKVKTEFNQSDIDKEFGEGSYDIYTEAEVKVDAYIEKGYTDSQIESLLKSVMTDEQYEMYLDIKGFMDSFTVDPSATTEADSQIKAAFSGREETEVEVPVRVSPSISGGSGSGGAATGAVGGGLSGTFSALQSEVTAQMTAISASVSTAMTTVSTDMQTGMTNAQTAVQSAMVSIVSTITSGMLSMVVAGRLGTTMFNIAFRAGLAQAVVTAQSIVSQIISVFSNLSSSMANAGRMAGSGFNSGLASQAGAIIGTANNIANSVASTIQSALKIASPSKVTTYLGEMVGAGLIAGMDGMISGVESSANRLSLATLPTTDLGSSRYSGSVSGQSTASKLDEVIDAINRGQVIMMDSGALVGETSRQMDVALGQQGSLGGRHKL